jgi:hypothetical protein
MSAMIRDLLALLLANPGLALLATLLVLCVILILPVIAAFRRKAREEERERERATRRRPPPGRSLEPREPRLGPVARYLQDDDEDDEDDGAGYGRSGFGAGPPRRGRALPAGGLAKFAWFGLGVAVGVGLMAVNNSTFTLSTLFNMPIGAGPDTVVEREKPAAKPKGPRAPKAKEAARAPAAEEDPVKLAEEALAKLPKNAPAPALQAAPIDKQIADFVGGMRPRLPMPIGRDINLVEINARDRVVTLAFAIQLAIPESDYPKLQETLNQRFRAGICKGNDELRIRALNEAGVSFSVVYADLVGKTVARLEMKPDYCKETG